MFLGHFEGGKKRLSTKRKWLCEQGEPQTLKKYYKRKTKHISFPLKKKKKMVEAYKTQWTKQDFTSADYLKGHFHLLVVKNQKQSRVLK